MSLSKDDFLAISYVKTEEVPLPEVTSSIFVRTMSGAEREKFEEACTKDLPNIRARLIVATACDAQGERIFSEAHLAAVTSKPAVMLIRIFDAAAKLNGLSKADVDELEKNFAAIPSDGSPSASPERCL
jgi:hypothetical protein